MKLLIVFLAMSFTCVAFGATLNLSVGETIVLQPNSSTTVTCGMGGQCSQPVANLKVKFDYCKSQVNSSVEDCLQSLWPVYVKKNPKCVEDALELCLNFCRTSVLTLDCLDICR